MASDAPGRGPLESGLWDLYERLRDEKRQQWRRDLPFDELLFDRWERARALGFGDGVSIYHSALVYGDVKVGPGTWIGPHTLLDGSHGLTIGSTCSISTGVNIYTHDTVLWAVSGGVQPTRKQPVSIGSHCYLGAQSVVVAGVTIGQRCVVAAHSLVNHDVPDGTIVGGVPARRLGSVVGEGAEARLSFDRG